MIPEKVCFTGLTVPTIDLLYQFGNRKSSYPYPANWQRLEFSTRDYTENLLRKCDKWLARHISGRWGSYEANHSKTIVLFFEDENDAILFKLMGGETACLEETQD